MVSFEIFVKAMPPSLLELKVLPSFCFAFKIPDDVAASIVYVTEFVIFGNNLPFYETRNIFRLEGFQNNFCRTISPSPRFYFEGGNDL